MGHDGAGAGGGGGERREAGESETCLTILNAGGGDGWRRVGGSRRNCHVNPTNRPEKSRLSGAIFEEISREWGCDSEI